MRGCSYIWPSGGPEAVHVVATWCSRAECLVSQPPAGPRVQEGEVLWGGESTAHTACAGKRSFAWQSLASCVVASIQCFMPCELCVAWTETKAAHSGSDPTDWAVPIARPDLQHRA
jgi:hypothetical protein